VGALSSKNKADLQDIADALSLTEDGTKEVLVRRINTFFDSHPHIRNSDRFVGLFSRASRRRADMNDAAQTQAFPNLPSTPSAPQFPLTTNIANMPLAGPIAHHNTFPLTPLDHPHFGFYPPDRLQNHYNTHHLLSFPSLHPPLNGLPPSHVASTTQDHTQLSPTFQLNSQ
jgi:hypothetical protein